MIAARFFLVSCSVVWSVGCGSAPAGEEGGPSSGSAGESTESGTPTTSGSGSSGTNASTSSSEGSGSSEGTGSSAGSGSSEGTGSSGAASSSSGAPAAGEAWLRGFGAPETQRAGGLGFTPTGELWVAGDVIGAIDLGTGELTGQGSGIYLGKFAVDGATLFAGATYSGGDEPTFTSVTGLAVDSAGAVILTGWLEGSHEIGGTTLVADELDVFVGKWDASGAPVWGVKFGAVDWQVGYSIAVGPDDALWLAGAALAPFEAGDIALWGAASTGMFVIRMEAGGTPTYGRWWGEMGDQEARAVAVCADGSVALAGFMTATLEFGAEEVKAAGAKDMFVARLDAEGEPLWIRGLGGAGTDVASHVQCGQQVLFAGTVTGKAKFGALELAPAGDADAVLGRFDLAGNLVWAAGVTGPEDQSPGGIGVDAQGDSFIALTTRGATQLGTLAVPGAGERDVLVARYAGDEATPEQAEILGDGARQSAGALALHPAGAAAVAASNAGTLAWEALPPVSASGSEDLALLRWVPMTR